MHPGANAAGMLGGTQTQHPHQYMNGNGVGGGMNGVGGLNAMNGPVGMNPAAAAAMGSAGAANGGMQMGQMQHMNMAGYNNGGGMNPNARHHQVRA